VEVKSVTPESPVGLDQIIHRDISLSLSLALGVQNPFRIDLRATTYLSVSCVCVCAYHSRSLCAFFSSLATMELNAYFPRRYVSCETTKRTPEREETSR
jgi:hypothetical protein